MRIEPGTIDGTARRRLLAACRRAGAADPAGQRGRTPDLIPVKGKVTYKGKPLTKGTITFEPDGYGRMASGELQSDGTFVLTTLKEGDGVVAGDHRVSITGVDKTLAKDALATKYASPNTSKLEVEVDRGAHRVHLRPQVSRSIGPARSPARTCTSRPHPLSLQGDLDHDPRRPSPLRLVVLAGLIASAPASPGPTTSAWRRPRSPRRWWTPREGQRRHRGLGRRADRRRPSHPGGPRQAPGALRGRRGHRPASSASRSPRRKFPEPSKLGGPKWEGMARDVEGNYYIIGAHVGKTDEERASKSVLLRFRLKDSDQPAIDDASVVRWDIARSLESALKAAGARREGGRPAEDRGPGDPREPDGRRLARRELAIGLRAADGQGPRLRGRHHRRRPSPDAELELKPLFTFEAEPREGVRPPSSPRWNTSPRWRASWSSPPPRTRPTPSTATRSGSSPTAQTEPGPRRSPTFEVAMKAEGLAVLGAEKDGSRTAVKLLITYDNDPHATKIPSRFQVVNLRGRPRRTDCVGGSSCSRSLLT